ncbi:hypothetical protein [Bacillus cereus group sp. BY6-1LC]|uniref:hypothetical protein n=1 Tax=Bacillus cereus group sp. BY6-1LC TaxID=3018077 RepID=UPI0022E926FC|nr:hypothetical protein [Bacillus cereus group sp. BY6-1LC]MDA1802800.1 hypothetical protein [Bacillus cereus group sp. BY6-1LC]
MFKTKIWKLKKNVTFYNKVINVVPKIEGTEEFWEDLKRAVIMNNYLNYDQFSALYYAVTLCHQAVLMKQPKIVIISLEDTRTMDEIERELQNPYEELLQHLYITLILSKEHGREFAEGSLKFSEKEYKTFDMNIRNELAIEVKQAAEKYVHNLHMLEVRATV